MVSIVYMAAGLSSRFEGKIKQFAKVGINNETFIECSINQVLPTCFNKIIFIVGEHTEKPFKEKFGNNYKNIPVYYALQHFDKKTRDRPWGTVDALCSALPLLKDPFIVCNGDDLYGENSFKILFGHLNKQNNNNENKEIKENATVGYKLKNVLPEKGSVNRGVFKTKKFYVTDIEEIFDMTRSNLKEKNLNSESMCSMNIFALYPETLKKLNKTLTDFKEQHKNDRRIECLLPVEISNLIRRNKIKMKIYPTDDKWLGITNPEDEIIVREELKKSFGNSIGNN